MIPLERTSIFNKVLTELDSAYNKHGKDLWGRHEFYGVMKEEVDEVWDDIKADKPIEILEKEIIQVIAVCVRYLETGDRYIKALNEERSKE